MNTAGMQIIANAFGVMDRAVVQEQRDLFAVCVMPKQVFQKVEKFVASFLLRQQGGNLASHGIQCAEVRNTPILSCRGNEHLTAAGRPAVAQFRMEMEFGFIKIEEGSFAGFFKRFLKPCVRRCLAVATCGGSWRGFKSSLNFPRKLNRVELNWRSCSWNSNAPAAKLQVSCEIAVEPGNKEVYHPSVL